MMPRGQELLQPVNPVFIALSLLVALALNVLPLGRIPWVPDMVLLLLAFWGGHQPLRVGMGAAFVLGLCMDVHQSALLGQHALAYTCVMWGAHWMHRRLSWLSVWEQALHMLPLFVFAHALQWLVRMLSGGESPGWELLFSPLLETALWPLASWVLLAPQRRPPDNDANRPL
ncbi:MAG: rod shape-determining protein MreD [Acidovorax sp.]|jgi:rod shape-determining protein MreD|nr:rod shape-determining protein MreD [Acidovorax sp.]